MGRNEGANGTGIANVQLPEEAEVSRDYQRHRLPS